MDSIARTDLIAEPTGTGRSAARPAIGEIARHRHVQPPSMRASVPVMKSALSQHRNNANSTGPAGLFHGSNSRRASRIVVQMTPDRQRL
jgi:hypothetical protein